MSLTDRIIEMQSRLPEPDPAAFSDMATREVEDTWLATASPSEQTKAMRLWFLERYCDPQIEMPTTLMLAPTSSCEAVPTIRTMSYKSALRMW